MTRNDNFAGHSTQGMWQGRGSIECDRERIPPSQRNRRVSQVDSQPTTHTHSCLFRVVSVFRGFPHSYSLTGGHVQTGLRSPAAASMRLTKGQNL